jgi:hypothetical protein
MGCGVSANIIENAAIFAQDHESDLNRAASSAGDGQPRLGFSMGMTGAVVRESGAGPIHAHFRTDSVFEWRLYISKNLFAIQHGMHVVLENITQAMRCIPSWIISFIPGSRPKAR